MNHRPKILRTSDFGETWEDISGFGNDSTSNNGFPDVMVYSLLVMPYNTDIIWAGTEIGIFESPDNGETWHYADNGLPAVSVWQMFVQDNTIVLATHGRGIWTTTEYPTAFENPDPLPGLKLETYPNPTTGNVNIIFSSEENGYIEIRIFDLSGKIVHFEKDMKLSADYQKLVNLNELAAGTYILTITTEENILNSKIVLQ
jgi:hypothetical protein